MLKASFFNFSFAFWDFVIRSLPAKSITCKVLLITLLSLSVNFILKENIQWDRDERSLNSVDDVWRNFSARINNLFASSKLDIFIGDKSGIIKFPCESSYIVNLGVESSRRLNICS